MDDQHPSEHEPVADGSLEEPLYKEPVSPVDIGHIDDMPTEPVQQPEKPRFRLPGPWVMVALILTLLLIGAGVYAYITKPVKKPVQTIVVNTQSLSNGTLNQLKAQLGNNGVIQEQLTITPDTLFKNNVTVQGTEQVQKDLNVGGNVAVNGTTTLQGAVTAGGNLAVRGGLSVNGSESLGGNLSVGGVLTTTSLSVGALSVGSINASGNFTFSGHLVPTGNTPAIRASTGASGGTATIDGNDTAGTITITVGSSSLLAGEMAIITFHTPFATTPKVQLTPVNNFAAGLKYYATQSPTFFTIDSASTPAAGASYSFNYFVTQ